MKSLSDIVTVSLGAAALVTPVYAKDRPNPTPGVRTAMELIGLQNAGIVDIITAHGWFAARPTLVSGAPRLRPTSSKERETSRGGALP